MSAAVILFIVLNSVPGHFKIDNSTLIWEKTYHVKGMNEAEIENRLYDIMECIGYEEKGFKINYEKYHLSKETQPLLVTDCIHQFDVDVEIRDNSYKIKCSDFRYFIGSVIGERTDEIQLMDLVSSQAYSKAGPKNSGMVLFDKSLIEYFKIK